MRLVLDFLGRKFWRGGRGPNSCGRQDEREDRCSLEEKAAQCHHNRDQDNLSSALPVTTQKVINTEKTETES